MRSLFRTLTITTMVAASVATLDAQPRRQVRPLPPQARERQLEMRERMVQRREAMIERRGTVGGRGGAGLREGRMGRGGAALREGGAARGIQRRMLIRRGMMRERIASLKPEQQTALRQHRELVRAERLKVGEEIRAGRLNREQARARMQKWREEHKAPVDLRRRPPGSED